MDFDIQGARKAGYSDDEIAAYLSKQKNFDKTAAEKAGYSPKEIIDHLSPTSTGQQVADGAKELFGRDPSKAGQVSASDYASRAIGGAGIGASVGGAFGLATAGPLGALGGALTGTVGGAVSGLLEATAEDLGFGAGTQFAAGMLAPGASIATKIGKLIEQQAAKTTASTLDKLVSKTTGIPLLGTATSKITKAVEGSRPVDVAAVEKLTGFKGTTAEAGFVGKEAEQVKQSIANKYETITGKKVPSNVDPEEYVYSSASKDINKATAPVSGTKQSFVDSSFFNRAASIEGNVNAAQSNKYKKLFEDSSGNPVVGQDVINNLRAFKYGEAVEGVAGLPKNATLLAKDARFQEGEKLEREFNGWLMGRQKQLGLPVEPWQAHARAAYEQVYAASAKDSLPTLFKDVISAGSKQEISSAANQLEQQIWNLSKSPEGQKMFWEQFAGNLKQMPTGDAKVLWRNIKDEVRTRMIKDTDKFNSLNEVMNKAQSPKDISRAARVISGIITNLSLTTARNL
jgi:hypothetical protein